MKDSICFRRKSSINNAAYRALRLDSLTSTIIEGSVKRHNAIIFVEDRVKSLYRDYIASFHFRCSFFTNAELDLNVDLGKS